MHRGVRIYRTAESGVQRSNFDTNVRVDAGRIAISGQDIDKVVKSILAFISLSKINVNVTFMISGGKY